MVKIGIIGKGFVGSAVEYGFSVDPNYKTEIKSYDKDPSISTHSLSNVVNNSDFVFISVPTPSHENGTINLNILDDALLSINQEYKGNNTIFLIRSTIIPGSTRKFQEKYQNIRLVFNPEFLTEKNANLDFINQNRFILGGKEENVEKVSNLFRWRFGSKVEILETNFETAELIKYMNNTFLCTKVSFLNEMKLLSKQCGADWEKTVEGFALDDRVGKSHLNVPGPDGQHGFGGSCFPKDIQALINFGDEKEIDMKVLKATWETNLIVREEKDWEKLEGRAITKKKKH